LEFFPDYKEVLAVVGVFFELAEKSHSFIETLKVKNLEPIEKIHFNELLVDGAHSGEIRQPPIIHYKGSLTSPPCSDIVNWFIFKDVKPISNEDLDNLIKHWSPVIGPNNARHCQPLCGRRVVKNF
jgi:carbonic anhydrase